MPAHWDISRLVAPKECLVCNAFEQEQVCAACLAELEFLLGHGCRRCGNPEVSDSALSCPFCSALTATPNAFCHLYSYRGSGRDLFQLVKYQGYWRILETMMMLNLEKLLRHLRVDEFEGIVPIPESFRRRIGRFYNPAGEIAAILSGQTGLPVIQALRVKPFQRRQVGLSAAERKTNAKQRFRACHPAPRALILVDDVLTTGSTMAAAQRCLMAAGAQHVAWFTLFRKI